jgi:predicted alpha/beta superfamily hydrolase
MRHSLLAAALFAAVSLTAQEPVAIKLESKVMGETRNVLVRTPASYATSGRAYPVLYLTDGDRQIQHTIATVDFLARERRMPEVIVVGISNTDRTRDLTPTRVERVEQNGQTLTFPTSGGGSRFLTFIATELIPYVESAYRTVPFRVFAGHSFGGLFALQTLYERPGLFHGVIAASPALIWDDRYPIRKAKELLDRNAPLDVVLVVTTGDEGPELDREFRALESLFEQNRKKGITLHAAKFGDEDHGSVVLPTHYFGLRKVFEDWRFDLTGDVATLYPRAKSHYEKLSRRYGYTIHLPEETANFIGYRLLGSGRGADAVAVFEANAAAYPQSANVHDSLGEAYERLGDLERARASYARAAERGKVIADPNTAVYEQNLARVSAK